MKDEPRIPLKHVHEHAVPTVIHHPEEDLPLLARWLRHAMENQTRFWSLLIGLVVVVIGLTVVSSTLSSGRVASNEAWTELDVAKTPAERVEIANKYPNTAAERWALLQAATEYYNKGFADLPANRDAALPELKKALQYFGQVAKEAPKSSPQARVAAFGVARTHEARNEIEKAIEQYELVAKTWPESDEGVQSKDLAETLRKPEVAAFYKELYSYKPVETTLPPLGQDSIPLPPGLSNFGADSPLTLPPPPPSATPSPKLPEDVFAPAATAPDAKKPEAMPAPEAKPEEPKPTPAPEPKPEEPKKPEPTPAPEAKPEEPKKPEAKPEEPKKPEPAPEAKPEEPKKPEPTPAPEAKPEEPKKPEPTPAPEAKPEEVKKPEAKPEEPKKPEPTPAPEAKPEEPKKPEPAPEAKPEEAKPDTTSETKKDEPKP